LGNSQITLRVTRFDPTRDREPHGQDYTIPYAEDMVVLDALNYIKDAVDGTLTYRWSCRMGICGSCGMSVNGVPKLSCSAFLRDYYPGPVEVEPLPNFPIVRDLVIDISDFLRKLSGIKPWIMRVDERGLDAGEHRQTPAQVDQFLQFSACINCMLCYAACPVYALEPEFLGPAAIALARRYELDSRDQAGAERLPLIASSTGIWECTYVGECSVVCPKGVDPAKAIQQSKVEAALGLLLPFGRR
jgi:fumarate reductase iron-sulfur subunit